MSTAELFEALAERYDRWYVEHAPLYASELLAVGRAGCVGGVEVGVGSGRFARPLGVAVGVDPAVWMLRLAGVEGVAAVGEALPFRGSAFPCALIVVTLCFADDPRAVLREAARVARRVVACVVPRGSPWGRRYAELGARGHLLYSRARFYTVREVVEVAREVGLALEAAVATLSYGPDEPERVEEPRAVALEEAEAYGFVCLSFRRSTR